MAATFVSSVGVCFEAVLSELLQAIKLVANKNKIVFLIVCCFDDDITGAGKPFLKKTGKLVLRIGQDNLLKFLQHKLISNQCLIEMSRIIAVQIKTGLSKQER